MIPTRLILKNFCQYENFVFDYQPGVTGIIGSNGAGKSNLLDEAQFFAFTGESSKNKSDLLKWGADGGSTTLEFKHAGKSYALVRNLHNSTVKLSAGDETWKNAQANAEMETILGMVPAMLHETCFVSQGNLWEILTMSHAKRMEYFQKLCDAVRAERLRGIVQEKLVLLPTYPDRTEELGKARTELAAVQAEQPRQQALQVKLAECKKGFDERMPAVLALLQLPLAETRDTAIANKERLLKALADERSTFQMANPCPVIKDPVTVTAADHAKAARGAQWRAASEQLEALRQKHAASLEACAKELGGPVATERLAQEARDGETEVKRLEREHKLVAAGKCPTCGQDYKGEGSAEQLQQKLGEALTKVLRSKQLYTQHETWRVKLRDNQTALELQEKTQSALADAQYFDPAAWAQRLKEAEAYTAALQKRDKLRQKLGEFEQRQSTMELELKQLREQRVITAAERQNAAEFQANYQQLERDLQAVNSELTAGATSAKYLADNIARIEAEKRAQAKVEELRGLFERGREQLHRERLPKLVMMTLLQVLNERLVRFLALFDLPFTVAIDDNFDFQAYFPGVAAKPAGSCLSGGQKVAVSIAFRMALAELLAGSLPIMVLDEPTNHLDAVNKEQIRDVLIKIRRIAEKGTAILVATHDPVLIPACNRVVTLAGKK